MPAQVADNQSPKTTTPRKPSQRSFDGIQFGLFTVAGLAVVAAFLHAIWPDRIDEKSAMFLGVAAAVLIIREIGKLEFGGIKIERLKKLEENVEKVENKVEVLEEVSPIPGRIPSNRIPVRSKDASTSLSDQPCEAVKELDEWNSDPNKGRFGGSSEANGRKLMAKIEPAAGPDQAVCRVYVTVRSTDSARPLRGKVRFHMHPTFGDWQVYDVEAKGGVAKDDFLSWGTFTIGAEADDGVTRLELSLDEVEGGTDAFYEN